MSWPEGQGPGEGTAARNGLGEPRPVAELDDRVVRNIHQARWWFLAVVGCVLAAAVVVLSLIVAHLNSVVAQQRHEITASCQFYAILAPLPVTNAPDSRWPSEVSVSLVLGARRSLTGERCGMRLPPLSPTVARGAVHYGMTLPG